jgi:hypothetical protein
VFPFPSFCTDGTRTPLYPLFKKRGNFFNSPSSKEGKLLHLPLFVRGGRGGVLLSFFLHRWNTNTPLSPLHKRGNFTISPHSKEGKLLQLPLFVRGGRGVFLSPYFAQMEHEHPFIPSSKEGKILQLPLFKRRETSLSPPLRKRGSGGVPPLK